MGQLRWCVGFTAHVSDSVLTFVQARTILILSARLDTFLTSWLEMHWTTLVRSARLKDFRCCD